MDTWIDEEKVTQDRRGPVTIILYVELQYCINEATRSTDIDLKSKQRNGHKGHSLCMATEQHPSPCFHKHGFEDGATRMEWTHQTSVFMSAC
ncbi:hypothetical protein C0J52_25389 [Blattella germanica]|nr:hypothetical protein C0J52_25389 [Blattella germanica]